MKAFYRFGAAVSLLALSQAALADHHDEKQDWVASLRTGLALPSSTDFVSNRQGLRFETDSNVGYVLGASVAKDFGDLRLSFDFDHRFKHVNRINVVSGGDLFGRTGENKSLGSEKSQSYMVNLAYKIYEKNDWRFYAGLGIGFANAEFDRVRIGSREIVSDSGFQLAGQATAEFIRNISDTWEVGLGARYWGTLPTSFDFGTGFDKQALDSKEVFFRIGYRFGGSSSRSSAAKKPATRVVAAPQAAKKPKAASKPATPAEKPVKAMAQAKAAEQAPKKQAPEKMAPKKLAMPAPAIIYFSNNSATLSAESLRTISDTAKAYRSVKRYVSLQVVGHADRLGNAADNMALSERRAEAVTKALIDAGVAGSDITTNFRGETENALPTPDGASEAQNRRVEITFQKKTT